MDGDVNIFVATPCYGGQMQAAFATSLINLVNVFNKSGIKYKLQFTVNESHITRARNEIAALFMGDTEYTHLFFIDSDIRFKAEDVYKLATAGKDFIVGAYPKKGIPINYVWNPKVKDGYMKVEEGLIEVLDGGCGFMCISRKVLEEVKKAHPELKYKPNSKILKDREELHEHCYDYFGTFIDDDGVWLSEDYALCRRWQSLGGRIFLDPSIKLNHIGTYEFEGDVNKIFNWDEFVPSEKAE